MKSIIMLLSLFLLSIILTGCAPKVVAGNERYVTLYDSIGVPGEREKAANDYCKQFGRIAQYQSKGGDAFECSGRGGGPCSTYLCVN